MLKSIGDFMCLDVWQLISFPQIDLRHFMNMETLSFFGVIPPVAANNNGVFWNVVFLCYLGFQPVECNIVTHLFTRPDLESHRNLGSSFSYPVQTFMLFDLGMVPEVCH